MTDKIGKAVTHTTAAIMGGMLGVAYMLHAQPPIIIREPVEHVNPSAMAMKAMRVRGEKLRVGR